MKLALCLIPFLWTSYVNADVNVSLPVKSQSVLVLDADTHEVLYEKRPDQVRSIASLTKLMTALVIVEANLDPYEQIEITNEDVKLTMIGKKATSTSLPKGSILSREELLRLTLMNSQNRAASALARTYPGGFDAFVAAMNVKAQELGMTHTTYVDPTGLYNENVSTAADLATLLAAANTHEKINQFSVAAEYSPTNVDHNYGTTNRLIKSKHWDISLQKTGYIRDAGRCVAMVATVAYKRVVIILLNTTSAQQRARDAVIIKYWLENNIIPSTSIVNDLSPYGRSRRG